VFFYFFYISGKPGGEGDRSLLPASHSFLFVFKHSLKGIHLFMTEDSLLFPEICFGVMVFQKEIT
jgi:hypothetical protein